jgi:hypothetical protein
MGASFRSDRQGANILGILAALIGVGGGYGVVPTAVRSDNRVSLFRPPTSAPVGAGLVVSLKDWVDHRPGEHEVRLSEPRYEDVVKKVTIQPGKTTDFAETMKVLPLAKPPFGRLRVFAPDKFEAVYVNGKFMGHAGEFNNSIQGLLLNPGEYTVKVVPVSGGGGHEEHVKIDVNKVIIVRAEK